ncbi:unnamed protein product [Brachionus calyciflorus]|uniref:Uncharacterized protein n=1 Tax=Brachionus calyciflorus TaxID=104777 RepID=A0A813M4E5_9BILA|nr:unnamed protein product [Brachionus calyciflorus]
MSMQGNCSRCGHTASLENISSDKLCKPCLIFKYEKYKEQCMPQCARFEAFLDGYKKQIDNISPLLNSNLENTKQVKQIIEDTYSNQIRNLNNEKTTLLALVDECTRDNLKFSDFKSQLNAISQNINAFKNPNQNLYQDNVLSNLIKNFEENFGKMRNIEENFNTLYARPVKKIEKFEPVSTSSQKLIGTLSISEQMVRSSPSSVLSNLPNMFSPIRENTQPLGNTNLNNLQKWKAKAIDNPNLDIEIGKIPAHLTNFRNYMFLLDEKDTLLVFTLTSNNQFEFKRKSKSPIKTARNIAANLNYFAMSYINIDKSCCKKLNLKPCGVALFPRNADIVDFNTVISIELGSSENFVHPVGIALNTDCVFVCDQVRKSVYKISIQNGQILAKFNVPEGNPYKLSINNDYLVLSDTALHRISLHRLSNLEMINKITIEQSDDTNGPYGIYLTNDNLIFFKNYQSSQLVLMDIYLNNQTVFKNIPNGIEGFTMLECLQQFLVVGVVEKNIPKLICYLMN